MMKIFGVALPFFVISGFVLFDAHILAQLVTNVFSVPVLKISATLHKINS